MSTLTTLFDKSIDPVFKTIGKRRKLIGYQATLNGAQVGVLHDCYSDAECALNAAAYALANDPPGDNPLGDEECDSCPDELRTPTLYCPMCLCAVDHVDAAAWLCRNDRCLVRFPDTQQLLTTSQLIERRRVVIDLASGICPNCGDEHHPQSCPEIIQAIDGGDHRLTLGRTLCRLRWRNYVRFITLISHIPAWQIGMYAEAYVAYIQSYSPVATNLTTADVLKAWAKLIHPDGPAAPAMRVVGERLAA